jgi:hypothetical protein
VQDLIKEKENKATQKTKQKPISNQNYGSNSSNYNNKKNNYKSSCHNNKKEQLQMQLPQQQ